MGRVCIGRAVSYNRGYSGPYEHYAIAPNLAQACGVVLPDKIQTDLTSAHRAPGSPSRLSPQRIKTMAKGQKKSNKEIRKPKADKSKAKGASPTLKDDTMLGVEKKRR